MSNIFTRAVYTFLVHVSTGTLTFHSIVMLASINLSFVLLLVVPHD